jgi:hypothetical protein
MAVGSDPLASISGTHHNTRAFGFSIGIREKHRDELSMLLLTDVNCVGLLCCYFAG